MISVFLLFLLSLCGTATIIHLYLALLFVWNANEKMVENLILPIFHSLISWDFQSFLAFVEE